MAKIFGKWHTLPTQLHGQSSLLCIITASYVHVTLYSLSYARRTYQFTSSQYLNIQNNQLTNPIHHNIVYGFLVISGFQFDS